MLTIFAIELIRGKAGMPKPTYDIRIAETQHDRDRVYEFYYRIQVQEMGLDVPDADHDGQRLWERGDDLASTLHFFAGTPENIVGAIRIRVWNPEEVPEQLYKRYSMDRLPGVQQLRVGDFTRLLVDSRVRGESLIKALAIRATHESLERYGQELMFAECRPWLLPTYRLLSMRTYGGRHFSTSWGLVVPIFGISADVEYARLVGSPLADILETLRGLRREPFDRLAQYRAIANSDQSVVLEPAHIRDILTQLATEGSCAFLQSLPDVIFDEMVKSSLLVDVPANIAINRQGLVDQGIAIVIDGVFELQRDGDRRTKLGRGALFGQDSFLDAAGRRVASVFSKTFGRLLILGWSFLTRIAKSYPEYGALVRDRLSILARTGTE